MTTMTDARHGKRAVHNWANLPGEVLNSVAANYLAYRSQHYVPSAWLHPDFHYQRSVFDCLRDANDIQRLMWVCPQWYHVLANHDFWVAACRKLDRQDILGRSVLAHEAQVATLAGSANADANLRLVRNYHHFQLISQACCLPCRVNRPCGKDGIGNMKNTLSTAPFGMVSVCKAHRNNSFCGVCLKDISLASLGDHSQLGKVPESLFENEDFETWPHVHTTCFHCRRDALLRTTTLYSSPDRNLFEFLGGPSLDTKDYEARSTVDSFVDMAEGGVNDVINVLLERHWLRTNTNLGSLLDQAVASARYSRAELEEYESEDEMLSDDDDESYDMLQSQEEGGVRTLAVTAWARARIMDGNWVSPLDIWNVGAGQVPPESTWNPSYLPPTLHPVPYSLQTSPSNKSTTLSSSEIEDALSAESTSPSHQPMHYPAPEPHTPLPSLRFAQLTANCFHSSFRDILLDPMRHIVLRVVLEAQEARQDPCVRLGKLELDDVLALLRDERTWYVNSASGSRLMHAIPYVPANSRNMAPTTSTLVMAVWRDACSPLFNCQCSICDRALRNQGHSQGGRVRTAQAVVEQPKPQPQPHPPVVPSQQQPQRQIVLVENVTETVSKAVKDVGLSSRPDATTEPKSRKRSSAELDDPEVVEEVGKEAVQVRVSPASTPCKRQRTGKKDAHADDDAAKSRKRSSAELDDPEVVEDTKEAVQVRVSPASTPRKRQRTGEKDAHADDDAAMSSEPDSPGDAESGEGTGPGSPANSTGVPSETSLSGSSASDSSSLRSVTSITPLSAIAPLDKIRILNTDKMPADTVKVHGRDEEPMYDDLDEGVVYLH